MPNKTANIAKGALTQLKAGRLTAEPGIYLDLIGTAYYEDRDELTPERLADVSCAVCAKGALIIGHLIGHEPGTVLGDLYDRMRELGELFGSDWKRIEACFEGIDDDRRYYLHYEDDDERLGAILENLIRNDGTFIPEQDLTATA